MTTLVPPATGPLCHLRRLQSVSLESLTLHKFTVFVAVIAAVCLWGEHVAWIAGPDTNDEENLSLLDVSNKIWQILKEKSFIEFDSVPEGIQPRSKGDSRLAPRWGPCSVPTAETAHKYERPG
ncbi:hypothetical protein E2C01_025948 [Portunus trituberculatus]|uniref:Uncharacterized protein n=1 Tax=Portunus trituberculatus TaxID=210409 RepID=A0A5B7EHJ1_PORTR|nr:hypothetical protein [Portunus trituberculatus]